MVISRYPSASFDTILSNLFWNVHLLHPGGGGGEEGPAVVPGDELVQAGFFLLKLYQQILQKQSIFQTFFNIVNTALIDVSIANNLFHGMSGAKSADYHGSCSFLSIHLFWNVSFCL
jgi:hypothetical protein